MDSAKNVLYPSQMNVWCCLYFGLFLMFVCVSAQAKERFVFDTLEQKLQFENTLKEFRCVTCPNQSLADSSAPVAQAMQEEIYHSLQNGESMVSIRERLIDSYGDYVLYRPPLDQRTWLLWLFPL